ncbi:MAG: hypothetical protein ACI8PZ_007587 [Myxococcota bacterium]
MNRRVAKTHAHVRASAAMPLDDHFATLDLTEPLHPRTRELLDSLEATLDRVRPTRLDRAHSSIAPVATGLSLELAHRDDDGLSLGMGAFGAEVVVNYGEEHLHFDTERGRVEPSAETAPAEPVAFLEALLTGRIQLHTTHRLFWLSTRSFRLDDAGELQPFFSSGTLIPTFKWTAQPIVRTFDFR